VGDPGTVVARGVTLVPATSVGAPVGGLELRIDRGGITQLGGTPLNAWQIPWLACRDVRTSHEGGRAVLALSFGALRYRWEIPDAGVDGGGEAVLAALREYAGARPMVRGVRGARRRD
jgi:hypothetical protein